MASGWETARHDLWERRHSEAGRVAVPLSSTGMIRSLGRALAAQALAACVWVAGAPVWAGTLEGTAAYRERIALPPDAVFEAVLEDVSRADAPATVLGRATIDPAGQPPFRFAIPYDDAAVQPGRRYAVRATVRHQGRLLFTTDRVYPVLGGGDAPLRCCWYPRAPDASHRPRAGADAARDRRARLVRG